jgi:hypothetical protein
LHLARNVCTSICFNLSANEFPQFSPPWLDPLD